MTELVTGGTGAPFQQLAGTTTRSAGVFGAARARWLRPASLAPHVVSVPIVALFIGAAVPASAEAVRGALGPLVLAVVFCCVVAMETASPSARETRTALLMLTATALLCPAAVAAFAAVARQPADVALAAGVAAAAPAAVSAGVVSRRLGLPERPPVWAALGGLAAGPVLLPLVAAAFAWGFGAAGTPQAALAPMALAERAALVGALPAAAAFVFWRLAPRAAATLAPDFRGAAVAVLAVLALCAGGTVATALRGLGAVEGGTVLAFSASALTISAGAAWAIGRLASVTQPLAGALSRSLLVIGVSRNVSFAWVAAGTALTPRGDFVLALAVVAVFLQPAAMQAAGALRSAAARRWAVR